MGKWKTRKSGSFACVAPSLVDHVTRFEMGTFSAIALRTGPSTLSAVFATGAAGTAADNVKSMEKVLIPMIDWS